MAPLCLVQEETGKATKRMLLLLAYKKLCVALRSPPKSHRQQAKARHHPRRTPLLQSTPEPCTLPAPAPTWMLLVTGIPSLTQSP